ncbi:CBS domain-containing protein [Agarivorans litoreus]|uniref:CBS domain-containing protein n=1 Tax=Agarivorans litoreus TaxID=1510455 RepID=UPI001C7D5425|nr:CBS domain-containing protein [Agarivorans litoreus]
MSTQISSFMETNVIGVALDDSVEKVCQVLDDNKLCCVPVFSPDGAIFGVISASDLVHFSTLRANPKLEHAWELCTHRVIEVAPDISIQQAAEIMSYEKIHHLIVTEGSTCVGIVSASDVLSAFLKNELI